MAIVWFFLNLELSPAGDMEQLKKTPQQLKRRGRQVSQELRSVAQDGEELKGRAEVLPHAGMGGGKAAELQ